MKPRYIIVCIVILVLYCTQDALARIPHKKHFGVSTLALKDNFDFDILPKELKQTASFLESSQVKKIADESDALEDIDLTPVKKKTAPIVPVQESLYLIQTVGWTALSFLIIWVIVQVFPKLVTYPYHYNLKLTDHRYTRNPQQMPPIQPTWLQLALLSYNSNENDIQRKINVYFLKGVIFPLFFLIGIVPMSVIFFGDNKLSSHKLVFIDLTRVGTVFVMCMFIFELVYRSKTMWLTILHHWGAVVNCILLLLWELDNLAYFKIVMVYGIFMFLEGPEMFIMIFFRLFGDTGNLQEESVQTKMNHFLVRSASELSVQDVNTKFKLWRRTVTKWMLGLVIFDAITKITQQIVVFVLLIKYWSLMNVELQVTLVISYIIFFAAQAYGPYIFCLIYLKLRSLNQRDDKETIIGNYEITEKFLQDSYDQTPTQTKKYIPYQISKV